MKICFVILHYLTHEDTIKCIESIEHLDGVEEATIIIVDNCSKNGSIEEIEKFIKQFDNCVIIKNSENLGFAKGNNIGYKYSTGMYSAPFVVVLNNDTIINQSDFIQKIQDSYIKYSFAVMGPDIISMVDSGHQNPLGKMPDKKAVKRQITKYAVLLCLSKIGIYNLLQKNFGRKHVSQNVVKEKQPSRVLKDETLHGACLVFSPIFTKVMNEPFCSETFLYKEEFILKKKCERMDFTMVFDSDIEIYHKEDSSTNRIVSSIKEKREFLFKNLIKSNRVLLKYL